MLHALHVKINPAKGYIGPKLPQAMPLWSDKLYHPELRYICMDIGIGKGRVGVMAG